MPPHSQTTHNDLGSADASNVDAPEPCEIDAGADTAGEDAAAACETVTIELNFKAFADNCPPTEHARRIANYSDPTIQDFADQALELAALRAELKRLNRDCEALQDAVRLRDMRLQTLREQLASARAQYRNTTRQLSEAQAQLAPMTEGAAQEDDRPVRQVEAPPRCEALPSNEAPAAYELSSTLELSPPYVEGSATIPGMPAPGGESQIASLAPKRQLIPVDHEGDAVLLSRDIITIGRTRRNDICIPSRAVSRDHARLLMSARSVTVFDMDSANGCFVNDKPVKRQKLQDGDVLRIGDRSYRFANDPSRSV